MIGANHNSFVTFDAEKLFRTLGVKPMQAGETKGWQYGDRRQNRFGGWCELEYSNDGKILTVQISDRHGYDNCSTFLQLEQRGGCYHIGWMDQDGQIIMPKDRVQTTKHLRAIRKRISKIRMMAANERFRLLPSHLRKQA